MKRLNINADHVAQADVSTPNTSTGRWGPATGVTDFVFRIAASPTGTALGSLSQTASARAGDTDRYYTVFDTAALVSALTSYVGQVVYVVLSRAGDLEGLHWAHLVTTSTEGS